MIESGEVPSRTEQGAPTWSTWRDAVHVVTYRPYLLRTLVITVVVGTALFCINQLDVVLRGDVSNVVWLKSAVTYVVPFAVSNAGLLAGCRRPKYDGDRPLPSGT